MTKFHLIVIGILMSLALIAILLLSGVIPGFGLGKGAGTVGITIWGTSPQEPFGLLFQEVNDNNRGSFSVSYIQKNPSTYESELIDALAAGRGPDIFFLRQDFILKHKDKVLTVPFSSFSERLFKDSFIEEGELFLSKDGIIAFPFLINPIVLYWNRDIFGTAGISSPPKNWEDFLNDALKITIRDDSGNIKQAGVGMGDFKNVDYAKEIISFLILQTGNPIVDKNSLYSVLDEKGNTALKSADEAVRFFTDFSDAAKASYSWNRSFPSSKNSFIGGILGMYFGYAGDFSDIVAKNSHLNFDVVAVPQIKDGNTQATFGKIEGLAISKSSINTAKALEAIVVLTGTDFVSKISQALLLPPVRRDILSSPASDSVMDIFYKSAVISKAWLEPDSQQVSSIFGVMIANVASGKKKISEAIREANSKIDDMLKKMRESEIQQIKL